MASRGSDRNRWQDAFGYCNHYIMPIDNVLATIIIVAAITPALRWRSRDTSFNHTMPTSDDAHATSPPISLAPRSPAGLLMVSAAIFRLRITFNRCGTIAFSVCEVAVHAIILPSTAAISAGNYHLPAWNNRFDRISRRLLGQLLFTWDSSGSTEIQISGLWSRYSLRRSTALIC